MRQRIAIIGSGISGLGAAWALHASNDVVVYEADDRLGGHSNTVDVVDGGRSTAVDTGFIVFNDVTYPNLTRLFDALDVPTEASDMTFSYAVDDDFEYGASLRGILAHPSNLLKKRFRSMLVDIARFRRIGDDLDPGPEETIENLLQRHGFSDGFGEDYLYPMTSAIWSARTSDIRRFPARSILRFLANHGLIEIVGRPRWRTVSGGSRVYVNRLGSLFADRIRLSTPVQRIERTELGPSVTSAAGTEQFDHVILATHSDQALRILDSSATDTERRALSAIPYQPNIAVLHSDETLMPRSRAIWSSWNAIASTELGSGSRASVTYWMNRLQNLDTHRPILVSLNPIREPRPESVHGTFTYAHPQFDAESTAAQQILARGQGAGGVWFAGAYMGYGFHEDGLQSGLNVAAALGSPSPWHNSFVPMSSAPPAAQASALR